MNFGSESGIVNTMATQVVLFVRWGLVRGFKQSIAVRFIGFGDICTPASEFGALEMNDVGGRNEWNEMGGYKGELTLITEFLELELGIALNLTVLLRDFLMVILSLSIAVNICR